jgi:hypothetical protein
MLALALLLGVAASNNVPLQKANHHLATRNHRSLVSRQYVPCDQSFGPGYDTCVALPSCYNKAGGEVCCSSGGMWTFRTQL